MEEQDRVGILCDHNIIESEYHVIISCPVYNELRGELFNYAAQLENNFNNIFVYLFTATDICFILSGPALIDLLRNEKVCVILDRKY